MLQVCIVTENNNLLRSLTFLTWLEEPDSFSLESLIDSIQKALKLKSSKSSIDVQDGCLTWLTTDTGCRIGYQLQLQSRAPIQGLHMWLKLYSTIASFPELLFQETKRAS